jgi:SOS-response transcriptional repressor LexA
VIAPTPRQLAIVTFWCAFTDERGYPPTLREACAFFGFRSTNAAASHVRFCIGKGLLTSSGGWMASRGVIVTALGRSLIGAAPPQSPPSHGHRHPRAEVRVRRELLRRGSDAVLRLREGGMTPLFSVQEFKCSRRDNGVTPGDAFNE